MVSRARAIGGIRSCRTAYRWVRNGKTVNEQIDTGEGAPHRADQQLKEPGMASHEIKEAEGTYSGFISMFKVGTVAVALIVALVVVLVS